ncbi:5-methyltetrahydropteroyltriglutamate--homocysteine methyltransferase [Insulibacter thermoxylanivorax]|uniref:5-methyltetrahydropteroyltriglutamate--homocysteine methyltransferase n=1 Tax=Insulibacter thermoxylanivorax TaxID=2749268 RepID=A0A916QEY9_9BACL|nr:5-methyltetrahydropteroyltriglutamate--homocysteine S-methyltransferase [Insulibacter thermoxylanivorax]GFR39536.1 5-methyltetrahydropteroyltriglutamate--homocysteine methyltransferase [Insulibacter thermoxylanivorax]
MQTSVIGYPRIGVNRELKFASERYFRGEGSKEQLLQEAARLRLTHWQVQKQHGITYIPSNDFSLYDGVLDTACLLNIIPARYRDLGLDSLETYYAMARGYQGKRGDVKALAMKKWYNTNYHYLVPELEEGVEIRLAGTKPFDEFLEAKQQGIRTKPVLPGAFTMLKLIKYSGGKQAADYAADMAEVYKEILARFEALGAEWVQFDEPELVRDLTAEEIELLCDLYGKILSAKGRVKVLLQTYFGDVRDVYQALLGLPCDGIGLDFVEGAENINLIHQYGWAQDKILFAGIVSGKNIWRNRYRESLDLIAELNRWVPHEQMVLSTSCSLLHVPYTVRHEQQLGEEVCRHLAFAEEKLAELTELAGLAAGLKEIEDAAELPEAYVRNEALFAEGNRAAPNPAVRAKTASLTAADFVRLPAASERAEIQRARFKLPLLPTTTIGSFPQTAEVRKNRTAYRKGRISEEQYRRFNQEKIAACIALQEELGLDVLVHGEYERNDMVEYFGECLDGFLFTEQGWVQSYGTRCVKPPIIWGDVSRARPITVEYAVYAKGLTNKPVKGMLTGPVTILNWSFPREDLPASEMAYQIALAIREEVLDLEAHGIEIIQIDEAALREKLPLRRSDWHCEYLDWAIPAFRLVHSGVKPETQIHTHMCYSEFADILQEIEAMDADVISFEASRSDLALIDVLQETGFQTAVGPGVYDIHSPRIPGVDELKEAILRMAEKLPAEKLWVNPDCGLKTRNEAEVRGSLQHMVQAAREVRKLLIADEHRRDALV